MEGSCSRSHSGRSQQAPALISLLACVAEAMLRLSEATGGVLRTCAARRHALLGSDCRLSYDGRIVNIGGDCSRIQLGNHARVRGELLVFPQGGRLVIGEWFYIGPRASLWSGDPAGIKIGDRVLVSFGVMIHDTNSHPLCERERFQQTESIFRTGHPSTVNVRTAPISIGDDVWIGANSLIGKGVSIGDRAIIGAGCCIFSDVPSDVLIPAGTVHRRGQ